jgi:hypothetical protein
VGRRRLDRTRAHSVHKLSCRFSTRPRRGLLASLTGHRIWWPPCRQCQLHSLGELLTKPDSLLAHIPDNARLQRCAVAARHANETIAASCANGFNSSIVNVSDPPLWSQYAKSRRY